MIRRILWLVVPLALLALLAASCGGGGSGGSGSSSLGGGVVAVVGDDEITLAQFNDALTQARQSYKLQKQTFPKTGSPAWNDVRSKIMEVLLQQSELEQKAKEMGITVTEKQIDNSIAQLRKQRFGGSQKKLEAEMKRQGVSRALLRDEFRTQLVSQAILKRITSRLKVTDAEIKASYQQNISQYTTKPSRTVRHILVKRRTLADKIYRQLKAGGDFTALAKKYSLDTSSKSTGGKLTITQGQTVAPFDKVAFSLKTKQIAKPVHTQFGWHVIQALSAITPAKTSPLSKERETIRQTLLNQKKADATQRFLDQLKREFASKLKFTTGYEPPATATATTTTATTSTVPVTTG